MIMQVMTVYICDFSCLIQGLGHTACLSLMFMFPKRVKSIVLASLVISSLLRFSPHQNA